MTMGTPLFAAPEQLLGKPLDHRADLFALGMTMFEMLTGGMTPIDGHLMEVVSAKTTQDTPRISERAPELRIPPELDDLVARLTRRKPTERYASAQEVIDVLDRLRLGRGSGKRSKKPARPAAPDPLFTLGEAPPREAAGRREVSIPGVLRVAGEGAEPADRDPQARVPTEELAAQHRSSRRGWLLAGLFAACGVAAAMWVAIDGRSRAGRVPPPVTAVLVTPIERPAPLEPASEIAPGIAPAADPQVELLDEPVATPARHRSPPRAARPPHDELAAAPVSPVGSRPRVTAATPRGGVLRARLDGVDVHGSLPAGAVQRAVARSWPVIARCTAALPGTVVAHFTIGDTRRARGVHAAGSTAATTACIASAITGVRTEAAPDVGEVDVTVQIAFVGTM
jgi:hypothetical protein